MNEISALIEETPEIFVFFYPCEDTARIGPPLEKEEALQAPKLPIPEF
jgi:hypothetical protein